MKRENNASSSFKAIKFEGMIPTSSSSERSLRLLTSIAEAGCPLSLAELANNLNLPKATAHRLCTHLLDLGFISRDLDELTFAVGPRLRNLALDTLNYSTLAGLRHSVLAGLVTHVGETCNFTTLDGVEVLYLDRVEAPWPWRLKLGVGEHVPLHATASGKLFLATMEPERRVRVANMIPLNKLTPNTLVNPGLLLSECDKINSNGYSVDQEEFIVGLVAVAVPVTSPTGQVRAAIAIHGPTTRMSIDQMVAHVPVLQEAAERMSTLL